MATYVRAGLPEVATALAALTGEDHPLAISAPPKAVPSRVTCRARRIHRNAMSLMRKTDNGVGPRAGPDYRLPEDEPLPDLPLYERLIADGIAEADRRGSIVDHITARRLAIWLAARPQAPDFAHGLVTSSKPEWLARFVFPPNKRTGRPRLRVRYHVAERCRSLVARNLRYTRRDPPASWDHPRRRDGPYFASPST